MSYKPCSIDDIVNYSRAVYSGNLNYLINKSENCLESVSEIKTIPYKPIFADFQYIGTDINNRKSIASAYIQRTLGDITEIKVRSYNPNNQYKNKITKTYYSISKIFLKAERPETSFISVAEDVQGFIEEAFELATKQKLPKNILIRVCNNEELKQIHSNFDSWNSNIQGFAVNNKNLKRIFVKNTYLDELMLTIGHEIGHVFTSRLSNSHDEEAKAFSFALKWAEIIRENNIGNLSCCIKENFEFKPANNGLHDIAFLFVKNLINKGKESMQIHWDLVKGYISLWGFYN